jgi:osmotically-inducible protein OsmY
MTDKSNIQKSLVVFSLILIFSVGASTQTNTNKSQSNKPDCAQMSNDDIIKAVYDNIRVKHADQIKRINVTLANGVVTLEGISPTQKIKKEIGKIVKKTSCVKNVVNNLGVGTAANCGAGQKQCGDICIKESADCSLCRLGEPCTE